MMKTPMWGNALLILNVHQEHETQKFNKKFIRFSLDIPSPSTYCKARNGRNLSPVRIATIPQGILFLISEGMADD